MQASCKKRETWVILELFIIICEFLYDMVPHLLVVNNLWIGEFYTLVADLMQVIWQKDEN